MDIHFCYTSLIEEKDQKAFRKLLQNVKGFMTVQVFVMVANYSNSFDLEFFLNSMTKKYRDAFNKSLSSLKQIVQDINLDVFTKLLGGLQNSISLLPRLNNEEFFKSVDRVRQFVSVYTNILQKTQEGCSQDLKNLPKFIEESIKNLMKLQSDIIMFKDATISGLYNLVHSSPDNLYQLRLNYLILLTQELDFLLNHTIAVLDILRLMYCLISGDAFKSSNSSIIWAKNSIPKDHPYRGKVINTLDDFDRPICILLIRSQHGSAS
jgi:hypothetical protein